MSYQSLLQQHANQLGEHIQASQALQNVAATQKAQSLADKYNEVLEHYNAAAGGISTLSGAFHKGRKIYRGLQAQRAAGGNPTPTEKPTSEDVSTSSGANSGTDLAARPADTPPVARGREFSSALGDPQQTSGATVRPEASATGATPQELEERVAEQSEGASHPTNTSEAAANHEQSDADRLGEPRVGNATHRDSEAVSNGTASGGDGADSLGGDLLDQGGKRIAGKGLTGAVSAAGEEGGALAGEIGALDAIPVIGEIAGAGLGLYSLFHGLSSEPATADEEATKVKTGSIGSAVDPSAVLGKT